MIPTLETNRLVLRPITEDDIDNLFEFFNDPEATKYLPETKALEDINEWISLVLKSYLGNHYGPLAVINKASNDFMGYCGLYLQKDVDGADEVEILYGLIRRYWGNGYATEAAKMVYEWGKNELKINRFVSIIDPENVNSAKVAEKVGLAFEKEAVVWGRQYHIYSLEK